LRASRRFASKEFHFATLLHTASHRAYIGKMAHKSAIVTIRPRRATPILVCRKCLSRMAGGKKLKTALKKQLKRRSTAQAVKRPKLVVTGCLGICPKHAVTVASAATLQRGEYLLLKDEEQAGQAVEQLMPGPVRAPGKPSFQRS
jgi:predicted metal-binding protein